MIKTHSGLAVMVTVKANKPGRVAHIHGVAIIEKQYLLMDTPHISM